MKTIFVALLLSITLLSCSSSDDEKKNGNPFLNTPPVNFSLNLSLPEYNVLKFPGNSVVIDNQGIKGVVVYSVTESTFTAFELSDPNHTPNSCSKMVVNSAIATCTCDDENSYNIITGQSTTNNESLYPMQQYRTERTGDVIQVFN